MQALARLHSRHIFHAYLFIAPVIILFGLFRVLPSAQTLLYSFYKVELIRGRFTFIGLENFGRLFTDALFWRSLRNTAIFALVVVPFQSGLALGLALLVNVKLKGVNLFRTVYGRGSMTLEALHTRIGAPAFHRVLRTWCTRHRRGYASTKQFVALAEKVSGQDLGPFFQEWLFDPDRPDATAANGF